MSSLYSILLFHILLYPIHPPIFPEPGVPYNVTVRASTVAGKGEPVSIVAFSMQQGD